MNVNEGYEMAKHMTPGYKVAMGPHHAEMVRMPALPPHEARKFPYMSWLGRELGFELSLWARWFAADAMEFGHTATADEWKWLNGPPHGPPSLIEARAWLLEIVKRKAAQCADNGKTSATQTSQT